MLVVALTSSPVCAQPTGGNAIARSGNDSSAVAGPPVRRIESATAVSAEPLGAITNLRELSDGRVLLNDGTRRRLLLLDSSLTTISVVLDSLTDVQNCLWHRARVRCWRIAGTPRCFSIPARTQCS